MRVQAAGAGHSLQRGATASVISLPLLIAGWLKLAGRNVGDDALAWLHDSIRLDASG